MKIVYCHNYYRYRGGEDVSFDCDVQMLREQGHTVIPFARENTDIDERKSLRLAVNTIWNRAVYRDLLDLLTTEKPALLHCNNLFPQLSASVYGAARKLNIPVVQALRNYRTFCANSLLFREGEVCTKCLNSFASWHGIRYGCYRESRLASTAVVAMQVAQRLMRIHRRYVDAYFTPTHFTRQLYIDCGYDPESIFVRGNFVAPDPGQSLQPGDAAVFIGRLSAEKGISSVIDAWQQYSIDFPLIIIGDGPDADHLKKLVDSSKITFTGQLDAAEVSDQLSRARMLIMPSLWYETFGRTVAEAFAHGVPVVASRLGAMSELVQDGKNGFLFTPNDPSALATSVQKFLNLESTALADMRNAARKTFQRKFNPMTSYLQLLDVYEFALRKSTSQHLVHEARDGVQSKLP